METVHSNPSSKQNISAVIVAGGKGTRMKMNVNKQYVQVGDKPVLAHTINLFQALPEIKNIIIVVNEEDISFCKEYIVEKYDFTKVSKIVAGGKERQYSVLNGLNAVEDNCEIVLIHDGARPFAKAESILNSIQRASEFGASCVAVPVKDTIKKADINEFVNETIDRSTLWSIQTPQAFKYELIMKAHKKAKEENFLGTDDAMLVERLGAQLKLVMGSYDNIKITTKEDLLFAEAILKQVDRGQLKDSLNHD